MTFSVCSNSLVCDRLAERNLEEDMQNHDTEFCTFQEVKALVVTWNAGACTPGDLRYENQDSNFFRKLLEDASSPDILVFGFQELVDLEDKKLTASKCSSRS